jgi:hypothetical protein
VESPTGAKEVVVERFITLILGGWFLSLVILIVVLSLFLYAFRWFWLARPRPDRCPACHRPDAMLHSTSLMTRANVVPADRCGEPLGRPEADLEGMLIPAPEHLDVFRCRYCGHQEVSEHPIVLEQ